MRFAIAAAIILTVVQGPEQRRPETTTVPATVLSIERAWGGADMLLPLTRGSDLKTVGSALRALGRIEDPALVPQLLPFLERTDGTIRDDAAAAIAQTLKRFDPKTDPALITAVAERLRRFAGVGSAGVLAALGRIAYANPE